MRSKINCRIWDTLENSIEYLKASEINVKANITIVASKWTVLSLFKVKLTI